MVAKIIYFPSNQALKYNFEVRNDTTPLTLTFRPDLFDGVVFEERFENSLFVSDWWMNLSANAVIDYERVDRALARWDSWLDSIDELPKYELFLRLNMRASQVIDFWEADKGVIFERLHYLRYYIMRLSEKLQRQVRILFDPEPYNYTYNVATPAQLAAPLGYGGMHREFGNTLASILGFGGILTLGYLYCERANLHQGKYKHLAEFLDGFMDASLINNNIKWEDYLQQTYTVKSVSGMAYWRTHPIEGYGKGLTKAKQNVRNLGHGRSSFYNTSWTPEQVYNSTYGALIEADNYYVIFDQTIGFHVNPGSQTYADAIKKARNDIEALSGRGS